MFLFSCISSKPKPYQNFNLITLENEEILLYTQPDINSTVANTIRKGSMLFCTSTDSVFTEVFTMNPEYISKGDFKYYKYYLHNPKYTVSTSNYYVKNGTLIESPYDETKNYIRGERGGCYYDNSNGNKTYVNRSYCNTGYQSSTLSPKLYKGSVRKKSSKNYSSTCGARTKAGGYCKRKVKGGGRCYQH